MDISQSRSVSLILPWLVLVAPHTNGFALSVVLVLRHGSVLVAVVLIISLSSLQFCSVSDTLSHSSLDW